MNKQGHAKLGTNFQEVKFKFKCSQNQVCVILPLATNYYFIVYIYSLGNRSGIFVQSQSLNKFSLSLELFCTYNGLYMFITCI